MRGYERPETTTSAEKKGENFYSSREERGGQAPNRDKGIGFENAKPAEEV